jgi:pimeloyl-ACP methyl ester carboxylesterase
LGYLLLASIAGVLVAEGALHPGRRLISSANQKQARDVARRHDSDLEEAVIAARDGSELRAWLIRPRQSNGSGVILLHGVSDNRLGMLGYAEMLVAHGYTALLPDARAHGASGGPVASYGLLEGDDVHRWFDFLRRESAPQCIFGLAESMGAAQLLQALRSEPRFCAVAAESSFANFREIAYVRIGQFFHAGPWLGRTLLRPVVESAMGYARWRYGLNLQQASPEDAVATTRVPVLLIHGQEDHNIPVQQARRIVARNPAVVLWEVPGADHGGAVGAMPEIFQTRVLNWFGEGKLAPQL